MDGWSVLRLPGTAGLCPDMSVMLAATATEVRDRIRSLVRGKKTNKQTKNPNVSVSREK